MVDDMPLPKNCVIPEGYRRLEAGEYKQKGDLFFTDRHWEPCTIWWVQVNRFNVVVRRIGVASKIKPSPLPEVPAKPSTAARVKEYLNRIKK